MVGVLVFVTGSELLVRYVVAPRDSYDQYKAYFRTARASVAAFGDLHVADAIESSPAIANLGYPGDTLWLMLFKARTYVDEGRGRRIVLQYAPEQFALYRVEANQKPAAADLTRRDKPWLKFMEPHFRGYLLSYWRTVLKDPAVLLAARADTAHAGATKVKSFASWSKHEQRRSADLRVQLQAPLPQGRPIEAMVAQYRTALREFKRRGVDICMVEYPVTAVYRAAAAQAPTFAAMGAHIRRLAKAEDVRYVDLTAAMPDTEFANPDHIAPAFRNVATRLVLKRCFGVGEGSVK